MTTSAISTGLSARDMVDLKFLDFNSQLMCVNIELIHNGLEEA